MLLELGVVVVLAAQPAASSPYLDALRAYGPGERTGQGIRALLALNLDNPGDVFEQLGLDSADEQLVRRLVLRGGPVQTDRGFVLHTAGTTWDSTLPFSERVHLTTSRDILDAMAGGRGPEQAIVALGYAGWEAGQLEDEMAQNAWLSVPADDRLMFSTPLEQRWHEAGRLLGVNLLNLSFDAGRA